LNFLARPDPLPGVTPGLNVSRVVFILEMSLSTNPLKTSGLAVTAHQSARTGGSAGVGFVLPDYSVNANSKPEICKAQTSSLAYSNKMIKEDHLLACTTRMLEILVAPVPQG